MHRRKFLGTAAVGLAATALPVWLSRSFALAGETCTDEPVDPPVDPPVGPVVPNHRVDTRTQTDCAARPGLPVKPRLVLVIPADHVPTQQDRGHAFGEILNHGSDEQVGLFARFDVVCRRLDQLPDAVRAAVQGEPLMLVLDPEGPIPVRQLDAALPPHPDYGDAFGKDPVEDFGALEDRVITTRIATIAGLLRGLPDLALVHQADRERAALTCDEAAAFLDLPARLHTLTPGLIDRAAATTTLALRRADADTRARLWALLAAAAHARLTARPVDGAPWARGGGCGVTIEGDDSPSMMACGMGHVPRKSVRFLKFYASRY
jgi:hypothetical protein